MTVKEYLSQLRDMKIDLEIVKVQKSHAHKYTQRLHSPEASAFEINRNNKYKSLLQMEQDATRCIEAVENAKLRQLLMAYYVNVNTWEQTAEIMGKSYYHTVHRLHPQALEAVKKYIKCY